MKDLSARRRDRKSDDAPGGSVLAHIERILAVTEALSASLTPDGAARAICQHATREFEADYCSLHRLDDKGEWKLIGHAGLADEAVARLARPDAAPRGLGTNEIVWGETAEERRAADFPEPVGAFWRALLVTGGSAVGVLALGYRRPRAFSPLDRSLVRSFARQCAAALERARMFTRAQSNEERLRFLAEASTVLGSSLDYEATLASVARLAVPLVGDWAVVDMLQADGSFRRLAIAHVEPDKVKLGQEVWERFPAKLDDPSGIGRVARTGVPELFPEITDEMLDAAVPDPSLRAIYRSLGMRSSMSVPLQVRRRTVGVVSFVSAESGRRFGHTDLALVGELARRAEIAIENAQSFREAAEANRIKDEFLATISHELRTPLGAILGWAAMLLKEKSNDPTINKGLRAIERNARAQAKLIDDVLDVSRIITGKLRLDPKAIDPTAILRAALEVIRPAAEAKGVQIERSIADDPVPTYADPDRIQQIMWNLLSNAVKFTPRGGTVRVSLGREQAAIRLVVADTGEGIAADFLPFLFERFRQADSSTTRRHAGLGLGLAIARHLVEIHGGTIHADSEGLGKGSTFTVTLPMRALRLEPAALTSPENREQIRRSRSGTADLHGLRVLVCDDDPDTREILTHVLSGAGATVSVADSAASALEQMRESLPEVLVSDIGMPVTDGYGLIRQIRSLPVEAGGQIPALALTAYVRGEDVQRALASGFQMHAAKPVDPRELISHVASLGKRRASASR